VELGAGSRQKAVWFAFFHEAEHLILHSKRHHGLGACWVPETRGGTFQITSGADMTLTGFVLTDLVWTADQRRT
jgi:hypothetical protein